MNFIEKKQFDSYKIDHFDDHEKRTIHDVSNLFLKDKGQMICELSAKEKGFLETQETAFISYGYAKDLLI